MDADGLTSVSYTLLNEGRSVSSGDTKVFLLTKSARYFAQRRPER